MLGAAAFFLACLALFLYAAGLGWWTLPLVVVAGVGLFLVDEIEIDFNGRDKHEET